MKHKLLLLLCSFALLFTAACNKEKQNAEPTPTITPEPTATATPSPTPTPTPINLAISSLEKFSAALDVFQNYLPEDTTDYSNGVGYDFSMELTANQALMDAIGLGEIKSLRLDGAVDSREVLAANCIFFLNETKLLTAHVFTDTKTLLFNLPDYSEKYASYNLEELMNSALEESDEEIWFEESGSPVTELVPSGTEQLLLTNTITSESEQFDFMLTGLKDLLNCFKPQDGIEENVIIGTGNYTVTGNMHTAYAAASDLQTVLNTLANDPRTPLTLREEFDGLTLDTFTKMYLHYYEGTDNSFAWELVTDAEGAEPVILVSVPAGFCLYTFAEDGAEDILLYSEATGPLAGTIFFPSGEENINDATIAYEFLDNYFSMELVCDEFTFTMDYMLNAGKVKYNVSITAEGFAVLIKADGTPEQSTVDISLASFGQELLGMDITTTLRDYCEIPMPQNTVDADTWLEEFDMTAFEADMENIKTAFPGLAELFSDEEEEYGDTFGDNEANDMRAAYPNAFMDMTGYSVDEDGYVDFEPLEEEVFSIGEPSTDFDAKPITEELMTELFTYAASSYTSVDYYTDSYYYVFGNVYDDTVGSTYVTECCYYDMEHTDNAIWFIFDAVSEDLAAIYVDHADFNEALRMMNDLIAMMGVDYTLTAKDVESYIYIDDMCFGYDAAEEYYSIYFMYAE